MKILSPTVGAFATCIPGAISAAIVVNGDFSRDISVNNTGSNPAPVLYAGTGPALDAGTTWNDLKVPLSLTGDQTPTPSIDSPFTFSNLVSSNGTATTIDIRLTSGFYRSFNGTVTASSSVTSLQNDRVFSNSGNLATLTIQGLNASYTYDIYFINSGGFTTRYTIGDLNTVVVGDNYNGSWTPGSEFGALNGITPSAFGEISIGIQDGAAPIDGFGSIAGIQIVEVIPEPSAALLWLASLLGYSFNRRR